jgi:hypothetical protein
MRLSQWDGQYIGLQALLQPAAQFVSPAIDGIARHPGRFDAMGKGTLEHLPGQRRLLNRLVPLLWYLCFFAPLWVLLPVSMPIEFPVEQNRARPIGIGQENSDLTIGNLADRPAILGCHAH